MALHELAERRRGLVIAHQRQGVDQPEEGVAIVGQAGVGDAEAANGGRAVAAGQCQPALELGQAGIIVSGRC